MAHNIWTDANDVSHAAFARKPAWHNLGIVTSDAMTWQQAMSLAGLDWTVSKRELQTADGAKIRGAMAIFRDSNNAELGIVGPDYSPIQNRTAFDFCDVLLESAGGAHYEAAGALGFGEKIWCLARVPGADFSITGTDDKHESYLLFCTSHDGSLAAQARLTDVRVVCWNTLQMALSAKDSAFVKIKHTKEAERRLDSAKKLMAGCVQDAKTLSEKLNLLATRQMTKESMIDVMARLFPIREDGGKASETRRENLITEILKLYESNDNNAIPQVRGTAYNLLNAVTEYTDHFKNPRITEDRTLAGYGIDKARAENALFGSGEKFKQIALDVIVQGTVDTPTQTRTMYASAGIGNVPSTTGSGLLDSIADGMVNN